MFVKLIVVGGQASRRGVKLTLPAFIGRSREADLTIGHAKVSRKHCELYEYETALAVRDNKSLNGTLVNDQKITEAVVKPGDLLTVGPLTFEVQYEHDGDFPTLGHAASGGDESEEAAFDFLAGDDDDDGDEVPNFEATAPSADPSEDFDPGWLDDDEEDSGPQAKQTGSRPPAAKASSPASAAEKAPAKKALQKKKPNAQPAASKPATRKPNAKKPASKPAPTKQPAPASTAAPRTTESKKPKAKKPKPKKAGDGAFGKRPSLMEAAGFDEAPTIAAPEPERARRDRQPRPSDGAASGGKKSPSSSTTPPGKPVPAEAAAKQPVAAEPKPAAPVEDLPGGMADALPLETLPLETQPLENRTPEVPPELDTAAPSDSDLGEISWEPSETELPDDDEEFFAAEAIESADQPEIADVDTAAKDPTDNDAVVSAEQQVTVEESSSEEPPAPATTAILSGEAATQHPLPGGHRPDADGDDDITLATTDAGELDLDKFSDDEEIWPLEAPPADEPPQEMERPIEAADPSPSLDESEPVSASGTAEHAIADDAVDLDVPTTESSGLDLSDLDLSELAVAEVGDPQAADPAANPEPTAETPEVAEGTSVEDVGVEDVGVEDVDAEEIEAQNDAINEIAPAAASTAPDDVGEDVESEDEAPAFDFVEASGNDDTAVDDSAASSPSGEAPDFELPVDQATSPATGDQSSQPTPAGTSGGKWWSPKSWFGSKKKSSDGGSNKPAVAALPTAVSEPVSDPGEEEIVEFPIEDATEILPHDTDSTTEDPQSLDVVHESPQTLSFETMESPDETPSELSDDLDSDNVESGDSKAEKMGPTFEFPGDDDDSEDQDAAEQRARDDEQVEHAEAEEGDEALGDFFKQLRLDD